MSELALFIVRLGFVAVLWIFVFSIISVIRADLFGHARALVQQLQQLVVKRVDLKRRLNLAGGVQRLPGRIPASVAMDMILSGEPIDGTRAWQLGLASRLVPSGELMDAALAVARAVAGNAPGLQFVMPADAAGALVTGTVKSVDARGAVINIGESIPSGTCIESNAHALARYAALCQECGLVPMVEPEVIMDGDHDIETCYEVTEATLRSLFDALYQQNVLLEGTILKASMVISGKGCDEQADVEEVAESTVMCLKSTVPAILPGVVFLSGGQSDEQSTEHLNAMNQLGNLPWPLSFSYGRAMQQAALKLWAKDMKGNYAAAQKTVYERAKDNGLAALGKWNG